MRDPVRSFIPISMNNVKMLAQSCFQPPLNIKGSAIKLPIKIFVQSVSIKISLAHDSCVSTTIRQFFPNSRQGVAFDKTVNKKVKKDVYGTTAWRRG